MSTNSMSSLSFSAARESPLQSASALTTASERSSSSATVCVAHCVAVQLGGERPSARSSHTATLVGDYIIVFGGYGANKELDDFCHIRKDSFECSVVLPPNPSELSRCRIGHSAVSFSKHIYVFGGWNGSAYVDNGMLYDVSSMQLVAERSKHRTLPPARRDHACVIRQNRMYVFGGWNCVDQFNDVWSLDNAWNWSKIETSGDVFSPRRGHSANVIGRFVFVFGGIYGYSKYLGDMYAFDTVTNECKSIPIQGDAPSPRAWHSAITVGKFVVVFGGTAGRTHFYNDMYLFDAESLRWSQVVMEGDVIEQRCSHSATLVDNKMIVFGGITPSNLEDCIYPLDDCFSIDMGFALAMSRNFNPESLLLASIETVSGVEKTDSQTCS